MISSDKTVLIVVDVQERLVPRMFEKEALLENLERMIKGARILGIPILWAEQNPEGLGPTVLSLSRLLSNAHPISKLSFSCCGSERFMQALRTTERKQILIAGIETHVCVYQTAMDLLDQAYEVQIVRDAVSSRTAENRETALAKIRDAGGTLTSTEIALFELLKVAKGAKFKKILKIVK